MQRDRRLVGPLQPHLDVWEDKLNGQYSDKAKSTLRASVEKKPQQLPPFELTPSKK